MQQQPPPATFEAKAERVFTEMRTFLILWVGQLVSGLGSGLTAFAIPVWIYQRTESVELFSYLTLTAAVPGLLISPFAGALVDRWDRRKVLIWGDVGAAVMTAGIAYLFYTDSFQIWYLYPIVLFGSIMGSFQEPAFGAAMTMLIPREHFTRAAGMMQTSGSILAIITPVLAGSLMLAIGIPGILLIDLVTFLVAMGTLLLVRIPNPPREPQMEGHRPSLLREAFQGWTYIRERPAFLGLLGFFFCFNFGMGISTILLNPLILSTTGNNVQVAGIVGSITGGASLVGGLLMSTWGGPKRRIHGVFGGAFMVSICMALAGVAPSWPVIAGALCGVTLAAPFVGASSQAIWMAKTPPQLMGRVFAMRKLLAMSALPIAMAVSGPLAERVFKPLMMPGGALAGSVGQWIGVGESRGIGLLLIVAGLSVAVLTALVFLVPSIRNIEDILPDVPQHFPGMPGMMPPPGHPGAEGPGAEGPAAPQGVAGIPISGVQVPGRGEHDERGDEPVAAPGAAPAGA